MVKKIIIISIVLFSLYNLSLYLFLQNKGAVYTDVDKVERFIYSGKRYKVVTAGSSLIGGFSREAAKRPDLYNLFLPPSGGCTGVKTIVLSGKIPDTLYLETNYLSRGFNRPLLDDLFDPFWYNVKFYLPALEKSNKFLPLMIGKLKPAKLEMPNKKRPKQELFDQLLAKVSKEYDSIPNPKAYNNILLELKKDLEYITSKGCTVVFFEIPSERELVYSEKLKYQRKTLKGFFNESKYKWIAPDTVSTYYTGDGKHLLIESFDRFNIYFKHQASLLKFKKS